MKQLRTINQAFRELKQADPNSAISKCFIRNAVINGELPFLKVNSKRLIDMEDLWEYISNNMKNMKERQAI